MKGKKKANRKHTIEKYFKEKKELHESLLEFIDNSDDNDAFYCLQKIIEKQRILIKKDELKHFLKLILNISNNHHRKPDFFLKIKQILNKCKSSIIKTLSSENIFNIFLSNKEILLFLFDEKIITPDKFVNEILNFQKEEIIKFCYFFMLEIRKFISDETIIKIEKEINEIEMIDENEYIKNARDLFIDSK